MTSLTFVLDQNLGLPTSDEPWKSILTAADIDASQTADLADARRFFRDLDQLPAR